MASDEQPPLSCHHSPLDISINMGTDNEASDNDGRMDISSEMYKISPFQSRSEISEEPFEDDTESEESSVLSRDDHHVSYEENARW